MGWMHLAINTLGGGGAGGIDCLSFCLFVRLSVCLSVCISVCMYVICLCVCLPAGLPACMTGSQSQRVNMPICPLLSRRCLTAERSVTTHYSSVHMSAVSTIRNYTELQFCPYVIWTDHLHDQLYVFKCTHVYNSGEIFRATGDQPRETLTDQSDVYVRC